MMNIMIGFGEAVLGVFMPLTAQSAVYVVVQYGAKGNDVMPNTLAFQSAIDTCTAGSSVI